MLKRLSARLALRTPSLCYAPQLSHPSSQPPALTPLIPSHLPFPRFYSPRSDLIPRPVDTILLAFRHKARRISIKPISSKLNAIKEIGDDSDAVQTIEAYTDLKMGQLALSLELSEAPTQLVKLIAEPTIPVVTAPVPENDMPLPVDHILQLEVKRARAAEANEIRANAERDVKIRDLDERTGRLQEQVSQLQLERDEAKKERDEARKAEAYRVALKCILLDGIHSALISPIAAGTQPSAHADASFTEKDVKKLDNEWWRIERPGGWLDSPETLRNDDEMAPFYRSLESEELSHKVRTAIYRMRRGFVTESSTCWHAACRMSEDQDVWRLKKIQDRPAHPRPSKGLVLKVIEEYGGPASVQGALERLCPDDFVEGN